MGRIAGRYLMAAALVAFGVLVAGAQFTDPGLGHAIAQALAGGLFTVALAVVVRD
jgi:hypothetical protein